MTRTASYDVRPYDPEQLEAVLELLRQSLAGGPTGQRTAEFFTWKHERNPFGRSLSLVAEEDGQLIGFRTFMRWRFRAGPRTVEAARAVDTATAPEHQGRGVFTRLTRTAVRLLRGDGVDLIFNTPNDRSLPGYLKMGWSSVGRMPIALRPVRPVRFVRGLRRAGQGAATGDPVASCGLPPAAEVLKDTDEVVDLLQRVRPRDGRLATDRHIGYLRWRYAEAPGLDYRGIPLRSQGRLAGLAIGRPRRRGPLDEFTLSEVLVPDGQPRTARALLRAATRGGVDHVAAHLTPGGTSLPGAGLRTGYVNAPGRGMVFTVNPLRPISPSPFDRACWRLSLGDLEVF